VVIAGSGGHPEAAGTVTEGYADNGGICIHYEVEGSGPPLVLMHGGARSLQVWRRLGVTEALRERYRLILPDARGHGSSDKPHDSDAYDLRTMASDVVSVLDELGIQTFHYWGYSMGAAIGLGLAGSVPERVRSICLGGTTPNSGEAAARILGSWQPGPDPCPDIDSEAVGAAFVAHARENYLQYAGSLTMPCLFYGGGDDPFFDGADACRQIGTNVRVVTYPGEGHGLRGASRQASELVRDFVSVSELRWQKERSE
jgi:pimeloyl-ACP methyl ester carboxylesterase